MGAAAVDAAAIGARVAAIRARMAAACARSGRDPAAVTLVAASKQQPPEALRAAWEAGVRVFGENRVQEAQAKRDALPAAAEWHLLGPLQSNKARAALDVFSTLQALDRPKIVEVVAREARARGRTVDAFLEVNLGGEATKHGFAPADVVPAFAAARALPGVRLVGLMAIPPPEEDAARARAWFAALRRLRDELRAAPGGEAFAGWLSMGMSDDFEVAIEEGATHVRVGTALFGPRAAAEGPR